MLSILGPSKSMYDQITYFLDPPPVRACMLCAPPTPLPPDEHTFFYSSENRNKNNNLSHTIRILDLNPLKYSIKPNPTPSAHKEECAKIRGTEIGVNFTELQKFS